MNFFFDALRREAGEAVENQDLTAPVPVERKSASAAAFANPAMVAAAPVTTAAAKLAKRTATFRGRPEKLVAQLKPPVQDSSIIAMEQCRLLRNRVRETLKAKNARSLMLTSATASEGKTLMSINLAYTLSQLENTRVLLVDGDLRRPSVESTLRIMGAPGITEYLQGQISMDDAVQQLSPALDVVTAQATDHSSDLVHSPLMEKFLAHTGAKYHFVVVDGPPLFPIVDAQVLGSHTDAVLLVVRAEHTPYDLVSQCERVESIRGKIIGAVLNCATTMSQTQYGKYGYSTYSVKAGKV